MSQALASPQAAYALNGQSCSSEAFYAAACDPQRHIVVQACAGAGKTWMLVSRIVRALLAGAQPHEILAITFTKKAAGEMRERLQTWLQEFAQADDTQLAQELAIRGISSQIGSQPLQKLRQALSNLYQTHLQATRPVQIRTFHSWFASLLSGAPLMVLEALKLPMPYDLLEDDAQAVELVWPKFYELLQRDEALHQVYREAVADAGRWGVQEALSNALAKRVEFALADRAGVVSRSMLPLAQAMPAFAGLEHPGEYLLSQGHLIDAACQALAAAKQKTYRDWGSELAEGMQQRDWPRAVQSLLRADGQAYALRWELAGKELVAQAQALMLEVNAALEHHAAWLHHQRMALLARALNQCFADLKCSRGWVDMGDLELAALHVLSDSAISGWMAQRLDAQIKHLLIDEFQDTNPLQWQALQSWLSGYAGAGGEPPRVFIVGDAKQSIYRFRRAEPQVFAAAARFVCEGLQGSLLSCDHTRRNAQGVVSVVNAIMAQAASEHAQDAQPYEFRSHTTGSDEEGRVIQLPLSPQPEKPPAEAELVWRDTLTEPRDEPEEHAVDTECQTAARWIAAQIASGIAGNDIMVLARQRDRLSRMRDALRDLGIESQIAEKTALIEQPEVQDVVALLDALISPSNDLALARALKSPLLGWSDEDLMALASQAKIKRQCWLPVLTDSLSNQEHSAQSIQGLDADLALKTASKLHAAQQWLHSLPPHDALSRIYGQWQVIERCMAAAPAPLRQRVQQSLQALLQAALQASGGRFLTPHAWVRQLKSAALKTPQAAAQGQAVKLMTVHGAKGLEAHTVLLLDTCTAAKKAKTLDVLVDWPGMSPAPQVFAFLRSEKNVPACLSAALAHETQQREREEINALYVAMTRAKSQLAISGHEVKSPSETCAWQRFEALREQQPDALEEAWHGDFSAPHHAPQEASEAVFLIKKLPPALVKYAQSAMKSVAIPAATDDTAARIGQCMHRLLELYRPAIQLSDLAPRIAASFQLDETQAHQALQAAQTIIDGEASWVWDSTQIDWQANEVELIHQDPDVKPPRQPQILRIDRLVKHRETQTWWVLDYKSSPAPQRIPELQAQLKQYLAAVQQAHPLHSVKAAFITAQGKLIEI